MDLLKNKSSVLGGECTSNPKQELFHHLESKGMKNDIITSFIRSIKICLVINPAMNLLQIDEELHFLGWNDFELDPHTFQLAIAYFETEPIIA